MSHRNRLIVGFVLGTSAILLLAGGPADANTFTQARSGRTPTPTPTPTATATPTPVGSGTFVKIYANILSNVQANVTPEMYSQRSTVDTSRWP